MKRISVPLTYTCVKVKLYREKSFVFSLVLLRKQSKKCLELNLFVSVDEASRVLSALHTDVRKHLDACKIECHKKINTNQSIPNIFCRITDISIKYFSPEYAELIDSFANDGY